MKLWHRFNLVFGCVAVVLWVFTILFLLFLLGEALQKLRHS